MDRNEQNVSAELQQLESNVSKDKQSEFISLFHLMNKELLLNCIRSEKEKPHQT